VGKPGGKGRPKGGSQTDRRVGMYSIDRVQDRNQWRALVHTVMNLEAA
jgi:hypothetical protein